METINKIVEDGHKKSRLPAELLGQMMKRVFDIIRRIEDGTLSFNRVMTQLQAIAEERVQVVSMIIEHLGIVSVVTSLTEKFIAHNRFVINTSRNAKVKISFLGSNFRKFFLNKVEEPVGEQALRFGRLRKPSKDISIIADLGGSKKAETTLSELFCLMHIQGEDQNNGALLMNGHSNIFYVTDVTGVVRAVDACWSVTGWRLDADSIVGPAVWNEDFRVFSSNSVS